MVELIDTIMSIPSCLQDQQSKIQVSHPLLSTGPAVQDIYEHSADMNNDKVLKTFSTYLFAKLNQFSFSLETKLVGFFYNCFLDMDLILKGFYSRWHPLII